MHLMAAFRSLLAGRRRGFSGALLIAALLLGVVTMHAMSGSPNAHFGPAAAIMSSADHDAAAPIHSHDLAAQGTSENHEQGGCVDCGGHEMASAMCLMVLVVLLAFARPGTGLLARLAPVWSRLLEPGRARPHYGSAPSLHLLGISRT
ncbi:MULTISPECIES: DUF6153 family protein [Cellulosimicrobium]|uniref:DUF6153 family protein n=1 Tax=Cellulosimicrobium TaxID=157920 RepID=UPI001BAC624D|nr:DUF6153 family protein [Cellulosimicrobium cellulans]QUC01947.1 hypothetical protein J5A69_19355 [Cellulosimicrobium cellulans]